MQEGENLPIAPDVAEKYVAVTRDITDTWRGFSALKVETEEQLLDAGRMRQLAKAQEKSLAALKKQALEPLANHEKKIRAVIGAYERTLTQALTIIDKSVTAYQAEQERKRREAQRKAREDADRAAEEERKRLAAEAKEAEALGDVETAAVLESAASEVVSAVPIIEEKKIKNEAISFRDQWEFEVVDFDAVPGKYKVLNNSMIGAVVRAEKDKTSIPGIKVKCRKIPVSSGRF